MASYTPNYHLSKPDTSYPFSDFRQSYNGNMDIIDQNLGGGGGGSSVAWNQIVQTGTKIAEIDIDGTTTDVYAPTSGGGSFTAGDGIDITSNVISLAYLTVVNGAVNLVFDDGT